MRRLAAGLLVPAALALACADDIEPPAATGTPPPPGVGATSTGPGGTDATSTGTGPASATDTADDTAGGSMMAICEACASQGEGVGFCAAPHIAGVTDPALLQWGCDKTCVGVNDTTRWCGQDAACCEGSCDVFGRCGAAVGSSGATTGSSDTATSSGTGTTGTTGTTGSGSASSTG